MKTSDAVTLALSDSAAPIDREAARKLAAEVQRLQRLVLELRAHAVGYTPESFVRRMDEACAGLDAPHA